MRVTIPQPQLMKTLQMVEHAVNDRSTLPILANVLIQTENNELILTATDLDVGIQCRFPLAEPMERGAVALPARKLATIIRELPDEAVLIEAKKNHTATLNCGRSNFRIPGLPAEDFPILPLTEQGEGALIPQAALKGLVVQTAYAMSTEETRFILNGALLDVQKTSLSMVATDGRRLAVANAPLSAPTKQPFQAVVPAKTVKELGRLLQGDEVEDVAIAQLKDNQLLFRFGSVTMLTRVLEGAFPPYDKVIPPPSKQTMTCDRQSLTNAIRRAGLMTSAASQAVVFDVSTNRLIISKETPEMGSAKEELPVNYSGSALSIAFNPEFWLDVLKVLEPEQVTMELSGADRPAVIRLSSGDGGRTAADSFTYIVLPMKVA